VEGEKKEEAVEDQIEKFEQTFSIIPETAELPPKSGINLQFRACSLKAEIISDTFQLQYSIGEDRTKNTF